jgi:anthranilate synthase component II
MIRSTNNEQRILVLDNYDSFIYNLVHYIKKLSENVVVDVFRNDKISIEEAGNYDKILLSPGPGLPDEAGILKPLIKAYAGKKSMLGVCLGHQAIAEVFGGRLMQLERVFHGIATEINITDMNESLFKGIPEKVLVGRYHSWLVDNNNLPDCFKITANDDAGNIMAISHKEFDIKGVQFHPESIMTEYGELMIKNWLNTY